MQSCDLGLIGLAVMGQNLALNLESRGLRVAVYNRTVEKTRSFMEGPARGRNLVASEAVSDLVLRLKPPRRVILMVQAGQAVDRVIDELQPHLAAEDVIMDGGNSHYKDTERRARLMDERCVHFLGTGISGGEEGALKGPSIMAGGTREAWELLEKPLLDISAKVGGEPCAAYLGPGGAGHFVKMVHNGIEYGYMQIIAEVYDVLSRVALMEAAELSDRFAKWNAGELGSFLIEITADVLSNCDVETGKPMVEVILDRAGQKGTGRWTAESALELGVPAPTISASVEARGLSARWEERQEAARLLGGSGAVEAQDKQTVADDARDALLASQVICYAQGLALLKAASNEYGYELPLPEIAKIWRGGCIIRSKLLEEIRQALADAPAAPNLLVSPALGPRVMKARPGLARTVSRCALAGVAAPALAASLAYLDGYRSARLPASLTQAQRDCFGAHTFECVDRPGTFHHEWKKRS